MEWHGDRLRARVAAAAARRFDRVGATAAAVAQAVAPVRTGALRRSIGYEVILAPPGPTLVLYVGVPYGIYQERRRHYLQAGLDAGLALGWPGATKMHFPNA